MVQQKTFHTLYHCRTLTFISNFQVSTPQWRWKIKCSVSIMTLLLKLLCWFIFKGEGNGDNCPVLRHFQETTLQQRHSELALFYDINYMEHSPSREVTIPQLLKISPAFNGNWRFTAMFTTVSYWSLHWARCIQSTSSHLRLNPSPSCFPTKTV